MGGLAFILFSSLIYPKAQDFQINALDINTNQNALVEYQSDTNFYYIPESISYRFGRRFGAQKLKTFSLRCSLLGGLGPASITLMNFLSVQVRFTLI